MEVAETPTVVKPVPTTTTPSDPGTPPPPATATVAGSSHKRGARSNHKKGKGRNQYSKDKEAEQDESPARSMSHDVQKSADEPTSAPAKSTLNEPKPKVKAVMPTKMSMLDMKRRVGAIMDFITRTQLDLAAEAAANGSGSSDDSAPKGDVPQTGQGPENPADGGDASQECVGDKDFGDMTCVGMMDVLTRDMVKWQNTYT